MNREDVADLWSLDARLAALGRGVGAMRLRIGEGLSKLESLGGIHALGFPTLESYAREALGRSGRWGGDARALARRLQVLPALRAALISGTLTTSMVELVVRVATPEDDADWVARGAQMTIRQMRVHLKQDRLIELEEDTPPARATISVRVSRVEALAFERARAMVEAVGATRGPGGIGAVEAMLAEGLGVLLARDPDIDLPATIGGAYESEGEALRRAELALLHEQCESAAESAVPPEAVDVIDAVLLGEVADGLSEELPDGLADGLPDDLADDVAGVDRALRRAAEALARRDVELAQLAARAHESELWRVLRFASFDHYCRERIGLSPSSVTTRIALAGRLARLPDVAHALVNGRIGYESATIVARVASPQTVQAWVERAAERTVKHLREEVDAVELVARLEQRDLRRPSPELFPPDAQTLDDAQAVERAALAIFAGRLSESLCADEQPAQLSGTALEAVAIDLPMTTLRLSVSDEVERFWRGVEGVYHYALDAGETFVAFLVRAVAASWGGAVDGGVAYSTIYERDRWRCASPICRSRNVTPHHVVFRSHGGGEQPGNLVSLCEACHLDLVHMDRMNVAGDAGSDLHWHAEGWRSHHRRFGLRGPPRGLDQLAELRT